MKFLLKLITTAFVLSLPLLANSVATLTALKGSVKIESASVNMEATLGAKLNEKDTVITADKSKAQIIFKDNTTVTVGKNSKFSISEYLYEGSKEPAVKFALLKGAMKVITGRIGKIAPDKFKVKTKTATIGIRGTNFHIVSNEDGSFSAYCTYGAISVNIRGEKFIVKQGFYLNISVDGKIEIREFSADELKKTDIKHYGKVGLLKGKALKDGLELDNTKEYPSGIVIKDISDKIQDAAQTATSSSIVSMLGWSGDKYSEALISSKVSLNFAEDGSLFNSATSWVEVLNKSNPSGELDNWSFYLSPTASSYVSKDEFTTTFSSVYLAPIASSTSSNAQLLSSSFSTHPDLASGDYMLWGEWSASVSYDYESNDPYTGPSTYNTTEDFSGLWITGEVTEASVIAAKTGSSFYQGDYRTIDSNGNTQRVSGGASLNVDFGADTASLDIGSYNYDMQISGNSLSGSITNANMTGSANGTFYGPSGNSAGGNFQVGDGSTKLKGIYQVTAGAIQ